MAAQKMKPGEREGKSEEQEESLSPGSENLQPEASIATSHMHGTLASVELPATLTCSRPTASCQLPSSVTYTKTIKKKESPPIETLANVITGEGKHYTTLTCFPKL